MSLLLFFSLSYLQAQELRLEDPIAAAEALSRFAAESPEDPLAPEALWDLASLQLNYLRRPSEAIQPLKKLLERYPESRPALRAQLLLERLQARSLPALQQRMNLKGAALRAWLSSSRSLSKDRGLIALHAAPPDLEEAVHFLSPYAEDPHWGWLVKRDLARRRLAEGQLLRSLWIFWKAGDAGSTKYLLWLLLKRRAPWLLLSLLPLFVWYLLRRRRRS